MLTYLLNARFRLQYVPVEKARQANGDKNISSNPTITYNLNVIQKIPVEKNQTNEQNPGFPIRVSELSLHNPLSEQSRHLH